MVKYKFAAIVISLLVVTALTAARSTPISVIGFRLSPLDVHFLWCVDADPHRVRPDADDGYRDVVTDQNSLADLP
jgi:hypothetical protein